MRLANDGSSCYIAVDVSHRSVTDIDLEDANRVPAIDDLSHDETEGSDLSEASDVFDVRRREDEPWSETASSSADGYGDDEGGAATAIRTSCSVGPKCPRRASLTSSTGLRAWWANP